MKKLLSAVLCLSLLVGVIITTTGLANDDITVELDGKKIEFDVKPEIIDGRTMVPLRKIFEEIGALVKWDDDTQTVSARKNSKTVTLTIDSANLIIDKGKTDDEGNPITETVILDVPAKIVSDRTLVPARAISESFGLNVDWDESSQKVTVTSNDNNDDSWKENIASINLSDLSYTGDGIEINGKQIKITKGGDYTVSGILVDGNITISAPSEEKVKLRLTDASISSASSPCIFAESADKVYITLADGTENTLTAQNSENCAIYSKENLEIKGDGTLNITSALGHGIKASDNLNIEGGIINISAASDGLHINDTFKMTGGVLNVTAVCDGIDSESIVNILNGTINIETNGVPITANDNITDNQPDEFERRDMRGEANTYVEFEKSTKGINAEWMMCISGGEINVNSSSHAIHCQDEIQIDGGKFTLNSKYEKGISAHGNLTVNGSDTVIDIPKSTEGLESKNILTINNGTFTIVSSDDAVNATGGNSGTMPPGGNFGGRGDGNKFEGNRPDGEFPNNDNPAPPLEHNRGDRPTPPFDPNGNSTPTTSFEPPKNGDFEPPTDNRPQPPEGENMFTGDIPPNPPNMERNTKNCLVINGGYLELYAEDDCLDSNGNLIINGGTIKAVNPNGSFSGPFAVIDPDGQTVISENANLIFAAASGNERNLSLTQNAIIVYCEENHISGDTITVSNPDGKVIYTYTPAGNYKTVLIASQDLKLGKTYTITIGNETFTAELSDKTTTIGTQTSGGGMGFGRDRKQHTK